ncbi:MAG: hypothetical protein EOP84_13845 [Verrucomicrobiaceae bacterium]|nr:MAG: hypothetical protein EOP84_13845 [Verrucomicrobiaceae bacterium]
MKRKYLELLILFAAALIFPAVVGRTVIRKAAFDPAPLKALQAKPPAYVFIGDSMARSRIDVDQFERLTGAPVGDLIDNGSASARWYLFFKNYLIASGARPKMTFIFFRDTVLNEPEQRTDGKYREELEEAMHEKEPVLEKVLSTGALGSAEEAHDALVALYPVQQRQTAVRESIEERLLQMASITLTRDGLRGRLKDTFGLDRLRDDVPSDLATEEKDDVKKFDGSPDASFLPHLLALAKEHQLKLCFVRVKRSEIRHEKWLDRYILDLREYLAANGALFYDETEDPEITPEMFGDGDHIDRKFRPFTTERFHSQIKGLLQ